MLRRTLLSAEKFEGVAGVDVNELLVSTDEELAASAELHFAAVLDFQDSEFPQLVNENVHHLDFINKTHSHVVTRGVESH